MDELEIHKIVDGVKTLVVHESIILKYRHTGELNREYAIQVYQDFWNENPGYKLLLQGQNMINHNCFAITQLSDAEIVANLNAQVMYCGGKNLLEGLIDGQQS